MSIQIRILNLLLGLIYSWKATNQDNHLCSEAPMHPQEERTTQRFVNNFNQNNEFTLFNIYNTG